MVGAGDPLGDFNRQGSDSPDVPPAVRAQLLGADWGRVTGSAWTRVKGCVRRGGVFQAIIVLFLQTDWLFGKLACSPLNKFHISCKEFVLWKKRTEAGGGYSI